MRKISEFFCLFVFLSESFQFLEVKYSIYLNRRVFVMHMIRFASLADCKFSPSTLD